MVDEKNLEFGRHIASQNPVVWDRRTKEENSRLAALATNSLNPILISDSKGNIIDLNRAAKRMLNHLPWEAIANFLPPDHQQIVPLCLKGEVKARSYEVTVQNQALSWTYHPLPALSIVYLHALDMTDYKQAEAELLQVISHTVNLAQLVLSELTSFPFTHTGNRNQPSTTAVEPEASSADLFVSMDGSVVSTASYTVCTQRLG
jgi:PAS domain-containing protein